MKVLYYTLVIFLGEGVLTWTSGVDLEVGTSGARLSSFFFSEIGHLTLCEHLRQKGCTRSWEFTLKITFFPLLTVQIPIKHPLSPQVPPLLKNPGSAPGHGTYVHVYAFWGAFFTNWYSDWGVHLRWRFAIYIDLVYFKQINLQKHPIYVFLYKIGILMDGKWEQK